MKNIKNGMKSTGIFAYLNKLDKSLEKKCPALNPSQLLDLNLLQEALEIRSGYMVLDVFKKLQTS